eukprot:6058847-Amphidinium_carterae.1
MSNTCLCSPDAARIGHRQSAGWSLSQSAAAHTQQTNPGRKDRAFPNPTFAKPRFCPKKSKFVKV